MKKNFYFIHKYILILCYILMTCNLIFGDSINLDDSKTQDKIDDDWYGNILANLKKGEYKITYNESLMRYQCPNRANNLRYLFHETGFEIMNREKDDDFNIIMSLFSYGKVTQIKYEGGRLETNGNKGSVCQDDIDIEYINDVKGLRQNFIVKDKLKGESNLKLHIKIEGDIDYTVTQEKILFSKDNKQVMEYTDLKVYDNQGSKLKAYFFEEKEGVCIIVEDSEAIYPIIIDPLSSTPDLVIDINQIGSYYGYSVSSAGDINGDGYSDVIIGAYSYDNGQINEGAAFVYYGSSSGLSVIPDWIGQSNQPNANYGIKVSSAGDVNGDGYSDVIIGANRYDNGETDEGAAFVYYGSSTGLSSTYDWIGESNQASAYYGTSVSSAGDVNGDGYSDVVVGAYGYSSGEAYEGVAFIYYGSTSGLSSTYDWMGESNQPNSNYSTSISCAGDVNGDGYSDVIIGAWYYDNGETNEGAAFVYYGSSSGLSVIPDWIGEGNQSSAGFGVSVSTAGDINGDGYSDVIIGASQYDNGETKGAVFLYYGSSSGLSSSYNWHGTPDQAWSNYGSSVSTAADINGDGYSDVIVGASQYDNGQNDEGAVFLYYGSATGLSSIYDWMGESNQANCSYGASASTAGDINGDGFSDLIIGAYRYDNGETDEGVSFIYYGNTTGLFVTPNWVSEGQQSNAGYGVSVSNAGDVNGDGYSDVIIGANRYDNGETDEGAAFVYYGSSTGLSSTYDWIGESNQASANYGYSVSSAGDVNGDGFSDVIIGAFQYDNGESNEGTAYVYHGSSSGLSNTANWIKDINVAGVEFGYSVSCAGDVNGDGFSDIIIGADSYYNGETDEGAAFIYYGSSTGLSSTYDWVGEGNQVSAYYGSSVSSAGDVNGDGFSDVIIGAYKYDNGETDEGAVFVYYGSSTGLSSTYDWMGESNQYQALFGTAVNNAGDVNGDGYSDVIIGANRYDNGETDEGAAFVYYGSSTGLSSTYDWIGESNQASANYGYSVSSAGDVNGDGFSDVIIGANAYDNDEFGEGKVFVYLGSSTGVLSSTYWSNEINQSLAEYGICVSDGGDVNGDGYSDILTSAHNYDDGVTNEGLVCVHYGNSENVNLLLQQLKSDETNKIVAPLYSNYEDRFKISMIGRTPLGRNRVKLQWEVKPLGTPFDGTGLSESYRYYDTDTAGISITENVIGLTPNTYYKWRARIIYDMTKGMPQRYSRWYYISDNAPTEVDLKTSGYVAINDINISGYSTNDAIILSIFGTGDEFAIQKRLSEEYIELGRTKAEEFKDSEPIIGQNEYRIIQYNNGKITKSADLTVLFFGKPDDFKGFYSSINELNEQIKQDNMDIYDINGRKINQIKTQGIYYLLKDSIRKKAILVF